MVQFEDAFAGEWVGFESQFRRDGSVELIPEYLMPPDLVEWGTKLYLSRCPGVSSKSNKSLHRTLQSDVSECVPGVKVKGYEHLTSSAIAGDTVLMKRTRLLPATGCAVDAVPTLTSSIQHHTASVAAFSDGTATMRCVPSRPIHVSTTQTLFGYANTGFPTALHEKDNAPHTNCAL
jgi:hypothetical protein